ncbi:unnamed protein product [Rotaria sordida]|uniref:Uncharacterized protein n=1 Tax=Rotaria sordida TaxID=392033 RepID=A0A815RQU0_9BILA|nr:unnamed protein product [Rotaria sordida]CAF1480267.1 unnamed protein product [Rotaria sordida]CAF4126378.1 unnamed protein product [Rotaria sordida]
MSEFEDLLELEQVQFKRLQLENKFLSKIPIFKSLEESDVTEFLNQADDIFNKLKYSDDKQLVKIEEKSDVSLQSWFRINHPIGDSNIKTTSIDSHNITSSDSNNVLLSTSILSPIISKTLIDRFVEDPIKFYGGKDNVITWLDEIEQQFKIMNLSESDKFNLIHICLKGDTINDTNNIKNNLILGLSLLQK